ncbi:hypothetical protein PIB30_099419 [Stylosanthes scabra]|uniref:Uncharacterized protein n=1 Tax=Stylosanthes scabra TaxID=79078 RepID=A0ABU6ZVM8_9FABA|nr:hypothetical protein [Stylosanthes scabra]
MRTILRMCVATTSPSFTNSTHLHIPTIMPSAHMRHSYAYAWPPYSFTLSFHLQSITHAYACLPTHMRGTYTLPPHTSSHPTKPTISHNTLYHPRICVQSCAYAWHTHCTSPIPLTSQLHYVTHAYASPRMHMRGQLTTHFLAPTHAMIYVPISHAYAYNSMHMRGALNFTARLPAHIRHVHA